MSGPSEAVDLRLECLKCPMMKLIQNSFKIFFSWKCSMVRFLCVCIVLREKSSSHVGGSWFWLLKKIINDFCIFALKITSCFLDRLENAYFLSCYRTKFMFWIYFGSKIKNILSWFFLVYREDFFVFRPFFTCKRK